MFSDFAVQNPLNSTYEADKNQKSNSNERSQTNLAWN